MPTDQTQATLNHHLESFGAGDLDALVSDYTDASKIHSQMGTVTGTAEIRKFFEEFMSGMPADAGERFEMLHAHCEDEVALIVWRLNPEMKLGTDTLIVQDGKIMAQTVVVYSGD